MKSIAIIGCYFGTLRQDASLLLKSINNNPSIDWFFFTDCDWGVTPTNVHIVFMSFENLRDYIQNRFSFSISLDKPYKLCDYRPAFGEIFQEYIEQYDFWGHCDFDIIFGDLRKFFSNEKLEKFDRIYYQGHLSIYRNNKKINELYKSRSGKLYYKKVFSTNESCVFDERDGMYYIFEAERIPLYCNIEYADIYSHLDIWLHTRREDNVSKLYPVNNRFQVFGYQNGSVYKWSKKSKTSNVEKIEYAYIHYSKKVLAPINGVNDFYITKKGLIPIEENQELPYERYYPFWDDTKMLFVEFIFRVRRKVKKIKERKNER